VVRNESINRMDFLVKIAWIVAIVLIALLLGAAEFLDWMGRLEIIERKWPKVWSFINNRTIRLLIYLFLIAFIYRDIEERVAELKVPFPVVTVKAPVPPVVQYGTARPDTSKKNEPLKMFITAQLLEKVTDSSDPSRKMFVLLAITNKKITPVSVSIKCNYDFMITEQPLVASQNLTTIYLNTKVNQISGHEVRYKMQSPEWGPDSPMEIPVLVAGFDNNKPFNCNVTQQP
jgi:hypothetical protein